MADIDTSSQTTAAAPEGSSGKGASDANKGGKGKTTPSGSSTSGSQGQSTEAMFHEALAAYAAEEQEDAKGGQQVASDGEEADPNESYEEDEGEAENENEAEHEHENEEDKDKDKKPKSPGLEKLAKTFPWAAERIEKQSAKIATLTKQVAEEGVKITPTPGSPLSGIDTVEALTHALGTERNWRDWCKANPEGGTLHNRDGSTLEVTPAMSKARLAQAEAVIEAGPEWKTRLLERSKDKPWEQAEARVPGMLTKGTAANKEMLAILKDCPWIKAQFSNWEVKVAAIIRDEKRAKEESTGKVRYIRVELDDEGKPVLPKGKGGDQQQQQRAKLKETASGGVTRSNTPAVTARGGAKGEAEAEAALHRANTKAANGTLTGDDFNEAVKAVKW